MDEYNQKSSETLIHVNSNDVTVLNSIYKFPRLKLYLFKMSLHFKLLILLLLIKCELYFLKKFKELKNILSSTS